MRWEGNQSLAHSRHSKSSSYIIMQRGTRASSWRSFYNWISASSSSSAAFAGLCHIYLSSFIPLQSFPFLMSYIRIKISTFPALQKGNDEANDGKKVCKRNHIHSFFFFTLLKFCKKLLRDPWMRKPYSKAKSYSVRGALFPDPLAAIQLGFNSFHWSIEKFILPF